MPMQLLPVALGALLGFGALFAWRGFRTLTDKSLPEAARRKGFWRLNSGLVMVAVSVFIFARIGKG